MVSSTISSRCSHEGAVCRSKMGLTTLFVMLSVVGVTFAEMFGKDSTVLTPSNMKTEVLDSDLPWVVGFYGEQCPPHTARPIL